MGTDLGENDLRESRADAGNLVESLDRGRLAGTVGDGARAAGRIRLVGAGLGFHHGEQLVDAGGEGADLGGQRVDLVEHHPGQFGVVIVESAGQRLDQGAVFGFHPDRKIPQGEWVGEAPGGACGAGSCCAGADWDQAAGSSVTR